MIIEDCCFCGGEADTSVDDDGYVFIGCKDANCPNNIFNSDNAFDNEFDAIVWWNDEARKVYEQCPKMVVQTNEDWFCGLSTEEKAKFIFWQHFDVYGKTIYELMVDASRGVSRDKQAEVMIGAVVEWLKQPKE